MHIEMSEKKQVKIKPVHVVNPLDEVLNKLTGANNARAIISWLAAEEDEAPVEDEPGSARHSAIKGL